MNTVYGLLDPITKELKYIGCTHKPKDRLREHIGSHKLNTPVGIWVSGLRHLGARPEMVEIESGLNSEKGAASERFWMSYFLSIGAKLLNRRMKGNFASLNVDVPCKWTAHYGYCLGSRMYNDLLDNSQPF
jgi:hypothetical protein